MIEGKRICVVVHYEGMSGAVQSLRHRLDGLAGEASVEFLVPGPGLAERELAAIGPVQRMRFSALTFPETLAAAPRHLGGLGAQVRRFRHHLRRSRPDLVVVTSVMVPAAVLAARLEGKPVLVHASELLNTQRLPSTSKQAVARGLLTGTAELASTVIACSEITAAQFGATRARVETLYPPIAAPSGAGDRDGFRRRYGIAPHEPCVAMVGNITRGRGQDLLLRAMPLVRARVPGARCLIVGEPFSRARDLDYRRRLGNLAAELGIEREVSFSGAVDRIADVYAAADLVVNPARIPESFGRVSCEALVAGRPVVSTRVGAVAEVLQHGRTALLVEPDSPEELAAGMARMLEDRDLAASLAAAGREDILRRFDPGPIAMRFRQILEETAAAGFGEPAGQPPAPPAQPPRSAAAPTLRAT